MRIVFKNWSPDQTGLSDGMEMARWVYPRTAGGYAPFQAIANIGGSLSSQAKGALSAQDSSGDIILFAGDAASLYRRTTSNTFTDISKSGGYSLASSERWSISEYGQRIIATNIGDPVQYYDMNSSSAFADLAGSPPQSRISTVIRDFLVLGNTTNNPSEIYWSGFNNSEQWTKGINQCDSQILLDGGWVQNIVGGEVGYIFQDRAITRMTYVGPPLIFQFDLIDRNHGLAAPNAIVTVGQTSYFYDKQGFFKFDPSDGVTPIGAGRVNNWFASNIARNSSSYITAAHDAENQLVCWSFVTSGLVGAAPDTMIIYNYNTDEWSYNTVNHEMLFTAFSTATTLEDLDTLYSSLDNIPASLDSRAWQGGNQFLGAFDWSHKYSDFSGGNQFVRLHASYCEPVQNGMAMITNIRPISDSDSMEVVVNGYNRFSGDLFNASAGIVLYNGDVPIMCRGRYFLIGCEFQDQNWTFIQGMDVDIQPDGIM